MEVMKRFGLGLNKRAFAALDLHHKGGDESSFMRTAKKLGIEHPRDAWEMFDKHLSAD